MDLVSRLTKSKLSLFTGSQYYRFSYVLQRQLMRSISSSFTGLLTISLSS
ncbi:hemopexin repeat-containing protein [Shewanella sp. HL-SH8]